MQEDKFKRSRLFSAEGGPALSDDVRLNELVDKGHENYFEGLSHEMLDWIRLRKKVSGFIVERICVRYSAFSLSEKNDLESTDFPDELVLTDYDIADQEGRTLSALPPERVRKAMAQRASYLSLVNSKRRIDRLMKLSFTNENVHEKLRPLFKEPSVGSEVDAMTDFKDWGYLTRFSPFKHSRSDLVQEGIYARIGKHYRSLLCTAPMPDTSGSFDALWTSIRCHMLTVIPRNSHFVNPENQLKMAAELLEAARHAIIPGVHDTKVLNFARAHFQRNICISLSINEDCINTFRKSYELGVRCFRLYSIATDIRVRIQTLRLVKEIQLRSTVEDPVELFIGQITSIEQYEDLRSNLSDDEWAHIDGFFIGNGGGVRCTTAETGMIVNTPSLILDLRGREGMDIKSIIVEGGVGDEPAVALLLGASGLSYAAGISGASIESPNGGLFLYDGSNYWSPQRGEASTSTKIIEDDNQNTREICYQDGEPQQVEGDIGYLRQDIRFVSMCGRIRVRNEWLAQCFVKMGVSTLTQLQALGTKLNYMEVEEIFGVSPSNNSLCSDLQSIPTMDNEEDVYVFPLPLRRRTNAMRSVANSIRNE